MGSKERIVTNLLVLHTLFFCLIVILLLFQVDKKIIAEENSWILAFCTIITAIGGVGAAVGIYRQLKSSKELNEAQFIVNLNTNFTSNQDIVKIFVLLEKSQKDGENPFNEDDKAKMTIYLTYFESIHLLLNRNILSYKLVNDLFAYRFFLAVHNKYLQDMELLRDASYYRDIFRLHKEWSRYRNKVNEETLNEEYSLDKVCSNYFELAKNNDKS
jgi:hypothetical protein